MTREDFEQEYNENISVLAEGLYKTYCNLIYEPYNLDYPEWGCLPLDTGNLFWESAVTLYMQEVEYL